MSPLIASQRLRLYDSDELDGVLQAMAHQAAALLPPTQAALIGIQRRGEPLAQRLQQHLSRLTGQPELPIYPLKVKRYADDLKVLHAHTELTENPVLIGLDLANTTLLVVDDVLFEGHSLLRTCLPGADRCPSGLHCSSGRPACLPAADSCRHCRRASASRRPGHRRMQCPAL